MAGGPGLADDLRARTSDLTDPTLRVQTSATWYWSAGCRQDA